MSEGKWFAEEKEIPDRWSWAILILFSLALVGWGVVVYFFVDDGPRRWDYDLLPYTPGESVYWTHLPPERGKVPQQTPQLPGARKLKPEEMSIQGKRP